jgi:hypothetical protein
MQLLNGKNSKIKLIIISAALIFGILFIIILQMLLNSPEEEAETSIEDQDSTATGSAGNYQGDNTPEANEEMFLNDDNVVAFIRTGSRNLWLMGLETQTTFAPNISNVLKAYNNNSKDFYYYTQLNMTQTYPSQINVYNISNGEISKYDFALDDPSIITKVSSEILFSPDGDQGLIYVSYFDVGDLSKTSNAIEETDPFPEGKTGLYLIDPSQSAPTYLGKISLNNVCWHNVGESIYFHEAQNYHSYEFEQDVYRYELETSNYYASNLDFDQIESNYCYKTEFPDLEQYENEPVVFYEWIDDDWYIISKTENEFDVYSADLYKVNEKTGEEIRLTEYEDIVQQLTFDLMNY